MALYVCSLMTVAPQSVPPGSGYTLLRFPFGFNESYDKWNMHQGAQPDGFTVPSWEHPRAGLIWPRVAGWATLTGMIYWDSGSYTDLRDRFSRDPLALTQEPDTTATEDRALTGGTQAFHKTHQMFVRPGLPVGLEVKHNARSAQTVAFAEFKMAIETTVVEP